MPREDYDISETKKSGAPVHKSEEITIAIAQMEDAITDFVQPANGAHDLEVINFTAGAGGQAFGVMLIVTPAGHGLELAESFVRSFHEHLANIEETGEEE